MARKKKPVKTEYKQIIEGEWFKRLRRDNREQCCDCGLIHIINYRIQKGHIEMQVFRDDRATAQVRRYNGIKVKRERE